MTKFSLQLCSKYGWNRIALLSCTVPTVIRYKMKNVPSIPCGMNIDWLMSIRWQSIICSSAAPGIPHAVIYYLLSSIVIFLTEAANEAWGVNDSINAQLCNETTSCSLCCLLYPSVVAEPIDLGPLAGTCACSTPVGSIPIASLHSAG